HVWNDTFGDHVHPEIFYQPGNMEKIGEFYGLAVTPSGELWMAGRYGVGLQPWNPEPHFKWVDGRFKFAFSTNSGDHGLDVPVAFPPAPPPDDSPRSSPPVPPCVPLSPHVPSPLHRGDLCFTRFRVRGAGLHCRESQV